MLSTTLPFFFFLASTMSCSSLQAEWLDRSASRSRVNPKRSGHATFVSDDMLLLFGGYIEDADTMERSVVNDLWEFQANKGWVESKQTGDVPGPRLVSAAASIQNKAYLLGGWDPQTEGTGGVILDTVHKYDSGEWKLLDVKLPGGPSSRHVALSLDDDNGILLHNHRCTDHVQIFDGTKFRKQRTSGTAPSSRGLHAATVLSQDYCLFFGGASQDQSMSNEAFVLNTKTWTWSPLKVTTPADAPVPRASPCLCSISDTCAILHGGAAIGAAGLTPLDDLWAMNIDIDSKTVEWKILLQGGGPPGRNAATLNPISTDGDNAKHFVLTGGWAPFVKTHDDCFVLKIT